MFGKKPEPRTWQVGDRFIKYLIIDSGGILNPPVERRVVEVSPNGEWIQAIDVNKKWKNEWYPANTKFEELLRYPCLETVVQYNGKKIPVSIEQTLLIRTCSRVEKYRITEISPSGKWIRCSDAMWYMANFLHVLDIYPMEGSE